MRSRNQKLQNRMFALVEQYLEGTGTVEQISSENNIASSKFKYWKGVYYKTSPKRKRYRRPPSTFIEIKPSGISNHKNIELEYPNGVKLRLADTSGIDLRSLINIV